jgi:AcrR family transcriptional regulator
LNTPEQQTRGEITRKGIQQAIVRIEKNRPKVIQAGRKISIAAVAEEAGVSRALIHNNYPDLATRIRGAGDKDVRAQRDEKQAELQAERAKSKQLREELDSMREKLQKMATELAQVTNENERLLSEIESKKTVRLPLR